MNEIKYFPEKQNSKYSYVKFMIGIISLLFVFHYLHLVFNFKKHSYSFNSWAVEIIIGIIGIVYFSLRKLTTEVCFDFEKRKFEVSYLTILNSNNKITIDFEKVHFELKKKMYRSTEDWVLYIYENKNIRYKIEKLKDTFTEENLGKIANQNLK